MLYVYVLYPPYPKRFYLFFSNYNNLFMCVFRGTVVFSSVPEGNISPLV